jgi:hypothetical protein
VPRVAIPRTCKYRRQPTYAKLLLRVYRDRTWNAFEGKLLKPGALIDEAELWPTPEYPEIPLLLEYAGHDRTGRGHRRSNDIYLLWRYERSRAAWVELIKCTCQGADWIEQLKPIAIAELGRAVLPVTMEEAAAQAASVTGRVLGVLDHELEMLGPRDRHLVMTFVYQEFSARAVAYA